MYDYQEACPVSKAAQVLCERWTLQIIREMFMGATRFSEFRQLLPRMSPTLLNTRLKTLQDQGIIIRKKVPEKQSYEYHLTPSGQALQPLMAELGKWGMTWVFDQMNPEQLNVSTIIRDFTVALKIDQLPGNEACIQISVTGKDKPIKKYIMVRDGKAQYCDDNIGYDVDIYLSADLETLGMIWFGKLTIADAIGRDLLKVTGQSYYVKNISKWLGISQLASCNK
jgi:DNA-binding HxlR family transcriptional regulator